MKIAYVFTEGRKHRLREMDLGISKPREFLFGLTELRSSGHEVDIYELIDFLPEKSSINLIILDNVNCIINKLTGLSSCSHLLSAEKIKVLNTYDIIIAGNEYIAFGLDYYRKRHIFDSPLIFFVMGMLSRVQMLKEKHNSSLYIFLFQQYAKKIYRNLLEGSTKVIFLGRGELNLAFKLFPEYKNKFEYLPFPVDTEYWTFSDSVDERAGNILFMGNDQQRNFKLLLDIATMTPNINYLFMTQGFVTSQLSKNVMLVKSDWKKAILSDEEIRECIQKSIAVILPLYETYQPSGQSVCQQSMACGKSVLISLTKGFWSPELLKNNEHLILVKSQDPAEWVQKINKIILDKDFRKKIGANGRKIMMSDFSVEYVGKRLDNILIDSLKNYKN